MKPGNETVPLRTLHIFYDVDNTFGIDPLFAHTLDMTLRGRLWGQTTSVATPFKVNLIAQCAGVPLLATVNAENAPFKFFHKVAKTEADQSTDSNYLVPVFTSGDAACPVDFKIELWTDSNADTIKDDPAEFSEIEKPNPLTAATSALYQGVASAAGVNSRQFYISPTLITNADAGKVITLRVTGFIDHQTVAAPSVASQNMIHHFIEITIIPRCSQETLSVPTQLLQADVTVDPTKSPEENIVYTFGQGQKTWLYNHFTINEQYGGSPQLSDFCEIRYQTWWKDQFGVTRESSNLIPTGGMD